MFFITRHKVIVGMYFLLSLTAIAQSIPSSQQYDAKELIMEIQQISNPSCALSSIERQERGLAAREKLTALGKSIAPLLIAAIDEETQLQVQHQLINILSQVPGKMVNQKLLHWCANNSSLSDFCGNLLLERMGKNLFQPSDLSLSEQEMLLGVIERSPVYLAGGYIQILAKCEDISAELKSKMVVSRFLQEIDVNGPESGEHFHGSYGSSRVNILNTFLLTFRDLGEMVRPYLRETIGNARKANNTEEEKWLMLGLGSTGDPDVGEYIKKVVLHDPDTSTRVVATYVYALSVGKEAIPLLKELLEDTTVSEYHTDNNQNEYIVARIAREQLMRLTRQEFENSVYMRRIADIVTSLCADPEKFILDAIALQVKIIGENNPKGQNKEILSLSHQIYNLFHNNDLNGLIQLAAERKRSRENDLAALIIEFNIFCSQSEFDRAIKHMISIKEILVSSECKCADCIFPIVNDLIDAFERQYRLFYMEPDKQSVDNKVYIQTMSSLYILEIKGCIV